jgi:hypothetical protein
MVSHSDIEMVDIMPQTQLEKPTMPSDGDNSEPAFKPTVEPQVMTVDKPKHSALNPFYSCEHPGQFDLVSDRSRKQVWLYRLKLLLGLVFPFFLSSLDTTIIATALPHIASEFSKFLFRSPAGSLLIPCRLALASVMDRQHVHIASNGLSAANGLDGSSFWSPFDPSGIDISIPHWQYPLHLCA